MPSGDDFTAYCGTCRLTFPDPVAFGSHPCVAAVPAHPHPTYIPGEWTAPHIVDQGRP